MPAVFRLAGTMADLKRLTFTCAIGDGVRLQNADGSVQRVRLEDLLPSVRSPIPLLTVLCDDSQQAGRFQRPAGQGVNAGNSLVRVVEIMVDGKRKVKLGVSAPADTLVVFEPVR